MNAAETIQAAIGKLEQLRDTAPVGQWSARPYKIVEVAAVVSASAGDEDFFVADFVDESTADLIVTLHRTIDAQLVLLNETLEAIVEYPLNPDRLYRWEIDLARAILGVES